MPTIQPPGIFTQHHTLGALPGPLATRDYERPPDPITRLKSALESRSRIERELGEGGMATVYLAEDERHNRNGGQWLMRWIGRGLLVLLMSSMIPIATACGPAPLEPFAATEYGYFRSGGVRLYYALDLPKGVERPPLIVLSHGSGQVNADTNADRAQPLVQRGFAVVRFDKRGVGKSEGEYSRAFDHMTVLADDLIAAVELVRDDPRIDSSRIGLMGASQAGWVVPEAAVRSPDVSFVILLSGPTVTGQQANYWDQIADDESLTIEELEEIFRAFVPSGGDVDPRPYLAQMQVPGLWIYGVEDRIVPAGPSAEILQQFVADADKPFTIKTFPGVGHNIKTNYWHDLFDWYDREVGL